MKQLLKIPAVLLIGSALYTWIAYDEYISFTETLFPLLNVQGAFKQIINWVFVAVQGGLGVFLWQLSGEEVK